MAHSTVYLYRADPSTLKAIKRWAADELRSSNSQIEYLLREALRLENRLPDTRAARAEDAVTADTRDSHHAESDPVAVN